MFRLMRFYSVTSFVIIFLAAAVLTLFYRQITINRIDELARSSSLTLANAVLNSIKPELIAYLSAAHDGDETDRGISWQELPASVISQMLKMTRGTSIASIKIFKRDGSVFFATQGPENIPGEVHHPGFLSAINGKTFSFMTYRDTFNSFEGSTADDNLMHTYIPIRDAPADRVVGVLEIHTDMNHVVDENNKALFIALVGCESVLAILYGVLLMIVRHARNIIENQQKTIEERTATLEILSGRLLKLEEEKKQKIAFGLHEGLAQTLSAIKVNMESTGQNMALGGNSDALGSMVPVLQSAIHEIRSIATELRPTTLDDLGLLPTISWYCREFQKRHSNIVVDRDISLQEATIPDPLKIVIYRIIESTCRTIAENPNTDRIKLALQRAGGRIQLRICHAMGKKDCGNAAETSARGSVPQFCFAEMKERATLSGGAFTATHDDAGWLTLQASWAC